MSYRRLGNYIQPVNNRNRPVVTKDLRGLSMTKEFRKSTSNIVGVDLSKYKLIAKNQFACDFMSVIRVHKFPVVLHTEDKPVIISPAYTVFETLDEKILNPEYLMMWFRRPEFDRYADFRCDSAIRGGFMWDELCDTELPIPSIEKQRQIVAEYNTVTNRIQLNEQLNQKLEDTAQALYKHWFVDFEFPNENGKPYKSSGGEMVFNEELEKDIPVGWSVEKISEIIPVKDGTHDSPKPVLEGLSLITSTHLRPYDLDFESSYKIAFSDYNQINKRSLVEKHDILFSMIGTIGLIHYVSVSNINYAIKNVALFKCSQNEQISRYILFCLKGRFSKKYIKENLAGSTQSYVTLTTLRSIPLLKPKTEILLSFDEQVKTLINNILLKTRMFKKLQELQSLLLAKMTQVETKAEAV